MIDQAFRRYGMTVTVEHGAETGETHGFVQPYGGERRRAVLVGRWARRDRRCWRYLGSAEVSVAQGTISSARESATASAARRA